MSKELLTPDKNKIIKLNAPDGEVSFNEDELLMIIQVCHNQLDRNIDCDKDAIHDYYHTAMTFKDPKILDSFGRLCSCLLYTSPSPRDSTRSRMPSSA